VNGTFKAKMRRFMAELEAQFEEGRRLEARIEASLRGMELAN